MVDGGFKVKRANWKLYIRARMSCPNCGWSLDGIASDLSASIKRHEYDECPKCHKQIKRWPLKLLHAPAFKSEKQKQLDNLLSSFIKDTRKHQSYIPFK